MEKWVPVNGWNGKYLISNKGRFKSMRGRYSKSCPNGYITEGTIDSVGYRVVMMRRPQFKERVRIHTLVCKHFLVKPNDGKTYWTNHKDGNKLNNRIENLEWLTPRGNCIHAQLTGLNNTRGSNHGMSKLTEPKVLEIRKLRSNGMLLKEIAVIYGVSRTQIGAVVSGENWGWLT